MCLQIQDVQPMQKNASTLRLDALYSAHPGYTLFDYQDFPPFHIQKAIGSKLYCAGGGVLVDAIASWWCKPLGHQHPVLKQAVQKQLDAFEHVMFGQTTFDVIAELSEYLAQLIPGKNRVFYAGDGSTAIEIALKMSLQTHHHEGQIQRTRFASLSRGYHGETLAALSLCDNAQFGGIFQYWGKQTPVVIQDLPYVTSMTDPLWSDASLVWERVERELADVPVDQLAAVVIEPICQAAGGMRFYSQDFLRKLCRWAKCHGIHVIMDEITTGFWRLGERLGSDYACIEPDFICLGKALTGGVVAMSAVVVKEVLWQVLNQNDFVHSNAYAGNAIGAAAALAASRWMENNDMRAKVQRLENRMKEGLEWLYDQLPFLENKRVLGGIAAFEIPQDKFQAVPDCAKQIGLLASQAGVFLRPIANTVYWCPPLTIQEQEIDAMVVGSLAGLRFLGV